MGIWIISQLLLHNTEQLLEQHDSDKKLSSLNKPNKLDHSFTNILLHFIPKLQVLEGKPIHVDCYGNLSPLTKSGQHLVFNFFSFKENRLPFNVKVKTKTKKNDII